jgi:serine/threonine protein kinase/Tol biopolymer transport system component
MTGAELYRRYDLGARTSRRFVARLIHNRRLMSLTAGTRLGQYEILSPIGAGGMGEVFRARDTRLDRDVALKVLPDVVAADSDRLARFTREAKTLAALNHPNIAQIYGVEDAVPVPGTGSPIRALVMEFVSGRGLDEMTGAGMTMPDAIAIAKQIVEALDAAHDAGVIHRDLKPANVRVRDDGTVKVLDFGLAKALTGPGADDPGRASDSANAPTLTSPMMTAQGIILGTAAYMAPEQAKGRPVDRRADIWAFGCVLYEMLTGGRPFPGDSMSETIANILKESPDWTRLPAATPSGVRRLLERCLEKDLRRRLQAIGDARFDLEHLESPRPEAVRAPASMPGSLWMIVAATALVLAVAGWGLWWRGASPAAASARVVRLSITPPGRYEMVRQLSQSDANAHWAVSADGAQIAFVVQLGATRQLMVRALDRFDARLLPGTENADFPFWSPDGSAIGFFADGKMKRVSISGDAVRTICDCNSISATWGIGVILLGADGSRHARAGMSLRTVPDTGGAETPLATEDAARQPPAAWPFFLPDGRHFIYLEMTLVPAERRIMLRSIDDPVARPLVKSSFKARYAASGHLIYVRDGVLVSQALDIGRATLTGPVTPLVDDMLLAEVPGQAQYEASLSGAIAYQARSLAVPSSLLWMSRDGRPGDVVMEPDTFITLDLSSDERVMAFTTGDNSVENEEAPSLVSLFDFTRKLRTRVRLADARSAETPLLSPDGTRVVFAAHAKAGQLAEVRLQAVNGTGPADVVARGGNYHPIDWSADGRYLLLHEIGTNMAFGRIELLSVDLRGDRTPVLFVSNDLASSAQGQFSPDGQFVAYSSDLSGRSEIYLRPFPAKGEPLTISASGGTQPRWRSDGRELYFVSGDGAMMAVPVSLGASVTVGTPVKLFDSGIAGENYFFYGGAAMYAPSHDGQRFLVIRSLKAGDPGSIRVVLNAVGR